MRLNTDPTWPRSVGALTLLTLTGLLHGCGLADADAPAAGSAPPPPEVVVVTATVQPVAQVIELSGRLKAYQSAEVRPQATGIVQQRLFTEGMDVQAGQPLYQLDAASYQTSLRSAEASLRRQQANLAALNIKTARYQQLLGSQGVSKQDVDDLLAQVALAEADVASSQAALASSKLNLSYTVIRAPISGRTGSSSVTAGALVSTNQAASLTTIQQLDPMYVDITQSSADVLRLRKALQQGQLQGNPRTEIELTLPDGSVYPIKATLQFSNVSVDASTGSVTLRAQVANPQRLLLPNMYVTAKLNQGVLPNAILLPQQAVTRTPQGQASVLVVDASNHVRQQVIEAPFTQGDQWVVTGGLQAGERVIVQGSQKIRLMPNMPAPTVKPVLQGAAPAAAAS